MPVFKYKDNYGLFTHIPKTGGSSIKQYFFGEEQYKQLKRPWKHETIINIKNIRYKSDYNAVKSAVLYHVVPMHTHKWSVPAR